MKILENNNFYNASELCDYIRKEHIQKEDIQIITQYRDRYTLFFWREEKPSEYWYDSRGNRIREEW